MSSDPLPPYFNLSPDKAMAGLMPATNTAGFGRLALACRTGQDGPGAPPSTGQDTPGLRLFSTWEITRYLIPVAPAHFRRVLRQNPDLPQGLSETEGGAKWFSFDEVLRLRAFFAAEGSRSKNYLPYRPAGLPARIVAVANARAGVGKTTTCAHLAMSAALDGYRVLVIDLDPQAAITTGFGGRVADEWGTVFPLLARHHATYLRLENQRRLDRGDPPVALDDLLTRALKIGAGDVIRPTRWPNIDLIGADLGLCRAEVQMPLWRMQARGWKPWQALADILSADGVLDRYDLILLDTPPALGQLTIAGLAAADILLVPLGSSLAELEATGRFFDMLHTTFGLIEEGENVAARALGRPELAFEWDAVRAVLTRHDASKAGVAALIQARMGHSLSPHRQDFTPLIGPAGAAAVYEADYRDFNRETYARGRATFDETWAGFKELLYGLWRRDELAVKKG